MNAFPNAATTASGPRPLAIPVARPATVTTSSGFILRTNPITTTRTPMSVSTLLRGASHGFDASRRQRPCQQNTRARNGIIEIGDDVVLSDLCEDSRARQSDEWLHVHIGEQHSGSILAAAMHYVPQCVHSSRIEQKDVPHPDDQHLRLSGDPGESVLEGFRRAKEKCAIDLVDLDPDWYVPKLICDLVGGIGISIVFFENSLLQRSHVRDLRHSLDE